MVLTAALLLLTVVSYSAFQMNNRRWLVRAKHDGNAKIVNGSEAKKHAYPFMALIQGRSFGRCGGMLINANYVLTAAHCVEGMPSHAKIEVLLGAHNLGQNEPARVVRNSNPENIFISENYVSIPMYADAALIRLNEPIYFNQHIQPICLDSSESKIMEKTAIVAGWGSIGYGEELSDVLLEVSLPIQDDSTCIEKYDQYDGDTMICAGYLNGEADSCSSDSGGPLFVRRNNLFAAVGIVSYGANCSVPGFPGVYTEIRKFIGWIQKRSADGGMICLT